MITDGFDRGAVDIYLLGLGLCGYLQVTRETEQALAECTRIFFLHTEPYIDSYLRKFTPNVENLYSLYKEGGNRLDTYKQIANTVMDAAKQSQPVALALYGHPMCFVTPTKLIRKLAPSRGLSVQMLPGISALDTLIVDLNFDPAVLGLVQYEATYCLLYQPILDPSVPCLVWQPGAVETRSHLPYPNKPERFHRLRDYLKRFYSGSHKVALATSASSPLVDPEIIWLSIDEIPSAHAQITGLTTLFIPPAIKPQVKDELLLDLMNDPEHQYVISKMQRPQA